MKSNPSPNGIQLAKQAPVVDNNLSLSELLRAKHADVERLARFLGVQAPPELGRTQLASLVRWSIKSQSQANEAKNPNESEASRSGKVGTLAETKV